MNIEDLQELENQKNTKEQEISEVFQGFADLLTEYMLCQDNEVPESFDNYTISYEEKYRQHHIDELGNYHIHYEFLDPYEDWDRTTDLLIPKDWLQLYLDGHEDVLIDVVKEKCKQDDAVAKHSQIANLKFQAEQLGFNLVEKD